MPSPGEDIHSWSTVAANNGSADPLINWVEGQTRKSVNNSSRSELAAHAKNRNLNNGSIVTTGTAAAQQFLSGLTYTTIPAGLRAMLTVGSGLDNIGPVTINMDGLGAIAVRKPDLSELVGGEFKSNCYVELIYNGTFWINLFSPGNIAPVTNPTFDGDPQAPTPPPGDNDQSIATTEWVQSLVAGGPGIVLAIQTFKTPGSFTYTPTSGMRACLIETIGGGGAGGVGHNDGPQAFLIQGAGGGSGGYSRKLATITDIGTFQPVTVGAGGASNGAAGAASSVGTLCLANGGAGGSNNSYTNFSPGGSGGAPGVGDITAAGAPGEGGTYLIFDATNPGGTAQQFDCCTGGGGSSIYGGGAAPILVGYSGGVNNGYPATNYGSGGGGGASGVYGSPGYGGAGSGGIVIITEFAGIGGPGPIGPAGPIGPVGPAGPAGAGTGDVIKSGTPTAGQYARWTDANHIEGFSEGASDFSTGDVKLTLKTAADTGWIMMNDQTIGDVTSGATYADPAAQFLFTLLWTNIPNAWCPVSSGRGVSAAADWGAHKTLKLPLTLGRALAAAGSGATLTARVLGSNLGEEGHVQTLGELCTHGHGVNDPTHYHPTGGNGANQQSGYASAAQGGAFNASLWGSYFATTQAAGTGVTIQDAGTSSPMNVMQPTSFLNVMIKL